MVFYIPVIQHFGTGKKEKKKMGGRREGEKGGKKNKADKSKQKKGVGSASLSILLPHDPIHYESSSNDFLSQQSFMIT